MFTFLFKEGINLLKKDYNKQNYFGAKSVAGLLKNSFNEDNFKDKPWGESASKIRDYLGQLEQMAGDLIE